jgi:putative ABC transport system ATP-binding protein
MMPHAAISLQNVSKGYDSGGESPLAVKNLTLNIFAGEVTVLMGPSGSGKTTLLSLIGALLAPTRGEVVVCGCALQQCDELRRQQFRRGKIGFIFQSYNLLASLTVLENIHIALSLCGAPASEGLELLEHVGLAAKAHVYPQQLSGGQRQRVAVARALAGSPPVLLADEPTAALDAVQGRRVMNLLRARAHDAGTTVVVVTHDPRVREFADRVIEMEDGRVTRIVRRLQPELAVDGQWTVQRNGTVIAETLSV